MTKFHIFSQFLFLGKKRVKHALIADSVSESHRCRFRYLDILITRREVIHLSDGVQLRSGTILIQTPCHILSNGRAASRTIYLPVWIRTKANEQRTQLISRNARAFWHDAISQNGVATLPTSDVVIKEAPTNCANDQVSLFLVRKHGWSSLTLVSGRKVRLQLNPT